MQFYNIFYERQQISALAQVQDLVILRTSIVVFYLQRYTVHNSTHIREIKFDHFLKNKIVRPRQVQQELIAAVQPRGKLILLNPYKNQVLQILNLPMVTQKNNAQWFFFNEYYIFQQSGMYTYREEGFGNSVGLATFKQATKVSSFKHNVSVKGATDNVQSSINQFDNNCTLAIYEPIIKRSIFNLQLLTLPSNQISLKSINIEQLFTIHKNIKVLLTKLISQEMFMICITSMSVRSLFLLLNQATNEILHVIQSESKFRISLLQINNDPRYFVFESIRPDPPSFEMKILKTLQAVSLTTVAEIVSGAEMIADYSGKRVYKWWTDASEQTIQLHTWSVYNKLKMYRHLLRERKTDFKFGEYLCVKVMRLLQ